ncbi:penicillin-binding transpeptidase domain-containing protein [Streptomyces sp. DSM 44917]|uniref:Penicillin-binding transpeptidase domain-containing protein n=1 Tax=Streptomyces boetiae TaxID=3075541 RepID=A0ABU2L6X4_9ACTN|nr:penicillin-binding transpeptidase domain-containing protein [Streptomyces sp. DSM 44917]MDT0306998.1 penicillin-binding transpeptidase domain-containing protein [Streptomyces sp. DSM 44917]
MNKPMRRVAVFCGLLILALLIRVNWVQFVQADELQADTNNRRVAIERFAHPRGDIIVEGEAITGSEETEGSDFRYRRTFTDGELWAPVTGFSSQAFGTSMLEGVENDILSGDDDRLFFNNTIDMFTGEDQRGGNVVTTLNSAAQRAAFEGLGDAQGAVAAIDPRTGAILALVSTPSYDPNSFAGNSQDDAEARAALLEDPDRPMINRALRETYPPGSTFKVVTAAAALENDLVDDVDERTDYDDPYILPDTAGRELTNQVPNVCEDATLRDALRYSCNSVFAGISNDLGNETMIDVAESFGFNEEHFTPVRVEASVYPEDNRPQNAQAGIGQASNRATPLQMAMVAAAVANDGRLMRPYMVDQLVAPNLNVIEQHEPEELGRPLSPENAQLLQDAMETVVEEGPPQAAQIDGVRVGGKTGTAQRGEENSENPFAWFISYALTDEGSPVAVAVVIEDAGVERDEISGSNLAAPIAHDVMQAVLDSESTD